MTRIDFYINDFAELEQRIAFACKLCEKAYKLGHQVLIFTQDQATAERVDQDLWSFRDDSFVPHRIVGSQDPETKVEICWQDIPEHHHDVLINLSLGIAPNFSRFQRVSEIVSQDPLVLEATRTNYKYYQDRGYPLFRHDLRR